MAEADLPAGRYDRALFLMNLMIERATGNYAEDGTYRALRQEFMQDKSTGDLLPRYVRTCRDIEAFWPIAKGLDPKWEGRRVKIREDFEPLLDALERSASAPLDDATATVLREFSADGVATVWSKALERREVAHPTRFHPSAANHRFRLATPHDPVLAEEELKDLSLSGEIKRSAIYNLIPTAKFADDCRRPVT